MSRIKVRQIEGHDKVRDTIISEKVRFIFIFSVWNLNIKIPYIFIFLSIIYMYTTFSLWDNNVDSECMRTKDGSYYTGVIFMVYAFLLMCVQYRAQTCVKNLVKKKLEKEIQSKYFIDLEGASRAILNCNLPEQSIAMCTELNVKQRVSPSKTWNLIGGAEM